MGKLDFIDYICRPYCLFFREGEKEDMACLGAQVAKRLAENARFDPKTVGGFDAQASPWRDRHLDEALFSHVCRKCDFLAADCEYREENPPEDAVPCGGLILLAHLLAHNIIDSLALEHAA